MKKIFLGNDSRGKRIELDFDKEKIRIILLAGCSGSGKSGFHFNLYKELSEKYSPSEIGFLFLDMTAVDFYGWISEYFIRPVIKDPRKAIEALHEVINLETDKKIFIHIEECDMIYKDRERVEDALKKIKASNNIYVVYSTSRLDREYLTDWMEKFIDLKVVFSVATADDSIFLLGDDSANCLRGKGERILSFNNKKIFCREEKLKVKFSKEAIEEIKKESARFKKMCPEALGLYEKHQKEDRQKKRQIWWSSLPKWLKNPVLVTVVAIAFPVFFIWGVTSGIEVLVHPKRLPTIEAEESAVRHEIVKFLDSGFDRVPEAIQSERANEFWNNHIAKMQKHLTDDEMKRQKDMMLHIIHSNNHPEESGGSRGDDPSDY